jgi:hypothetical protein
MTHLSLQEAAEQAGRSKVDIWLAIQQGALSARRTDEGCLVIDPAELFRVFERRQPSDAPRHETQQPPPASPEAAAADDIAVAFAALQVELTGLLGLAAEVRANNELRREKDEIRPPNSLDALAENEAHLREEPAIGTEKANDGIAETEAPIPTLAKAEAAETPHKRPWWRRLAG